MSGTLITKFILLLLFLTAVFTSCNGQVHTKHADKTVLGTGQSFTSKNPRLTKTQGTDAHQNVHCSLQDKYGNLWVGTTGEGVYKYDGKEFTQYTEKDGLANNKVWSILEDAAGNIWFGTDGGLSKYDGSTIKKISFKASNPAGLPTALPQQGRNAVWSMIQDNSGMIWFGTSDDLYCYDGIKFSRFLDKSNIVNEQKLQLKYIQCFLQDSNGTIWMGSGPIALEGVIRFDGKSVTGSKPNGDGWIRYMLDDEKGNIWFSGRQNGVFIYDGKTFTSFTEKTNLGSPVLMDEKGNIWFTGEESENPIESLDGVWRYDGSSFLNYSRSNGLENYSVWSMLEDREGNIWVGTRNCGLYRYDGKSFTKFSE